jgi:photosystem II stability/assembly factor-like uncharacterized protein
MKSLLRTAFCALLIPASSLASAQTPASSRWLPFGPPGGTARSFAGDPADHNHVFLGTVSGAIYETHDGGNSWKWLAEPGKRDDIALDNILVDPSRPSHVLVAAWAIEHEDGGLYVSQDGGKTWNTNQQLKGHSIRSMAVAPSNPKIIVVGALDGVYRSVDGGNAWSLISPAGSTEIHEVESVAIDPKNPTTIYAGTWHLPWKTVDGGANWTNMKEGIIDDSDVFSIIVDPRNPSDIYLSACSGIYHSQDQGEQFIKIQGIPSTARRTRVLMQDARNTATVFAGTTEGLWRTTDAGHTFLRNGNPSWIINDVYIDPKDSSRVLLATDRTGVLLSIDGGQSFVPSNRGFASRQRSAIAQDKARPAHLWVGVMNDKDAGGVFNSDDGGLSWTQRSAGLNGADIFSLAQAPNGTLLAGTRHGISRLGDIGWETSGLTLSDAPAPSPPAVVKPTPKPAAKKTAHTTARTKRAPVKKSPSVGTAPELDAPAQESDTGVYAMLATDATVFAATEGGLLSSTDNGHTWKNIRSTQGKPWRLMALEGIRVLIADKDILALSVDHGLNFLTITPPKELTYITAVAIDSGGRLWAGGRQGVFYSDNDGINWKSLTGLYVPDISSISYDRASSRVLITANQPSTFVYSVHVPDLKVSYNDSGWPLRRVVSVTDHFVAVTPYDGIVIQPRMVISDTKPFQ